MSERAFGCDARHHLVAIGAALLLAVLLDRVLMSKAPAPSVALPAYLPTFGEADAELVQLRELFKQKKHVVIYGSSELSSSDHKYIPYRFLPERRNVPVFAFGHAFNQSLAILGQLAAVAAYDPNILRGSKVVVLVSPFWFSGEMSPQAFLEFLPTPLLAAIYFSPTLPAEVVHRIGTFVDTHFGDFDRPTMLLRSYRSVGRRGFAWFRKAQRIPFATLSFLFDYLPWELAMRKGFYRDAIQRIAGSLPPPTGSLGVTGGAASNEGWSAFYQDGIALEAAKATGNRFAINDVYYRKHLQGKLPTTAAVPIGTARELDDLRLLVRFARQMGVDLTVVFEPINPLAYTNAGAYFPLRAQLKELVLQNGFPFVDLWEETYQPGMLTDVMHIGEYGWVKIDEAIVNHYLAGPR